MRRIRRFHVFEFLDQAWLPARMRIAMTAYLSRSYATTPFPSVWAKHLADVLEACGESSIVDLGSGNAGTMRLVATELHKLGCRTRITLTDLFPPESVLSTETFLYISQPVDARSVPESLSGIRTMFAAFHHFQPDDGHAILRDAFEKRRAICVFEGTSRTVPAIVLSCLIPLLVLVLTPSIRPRSLFRFVFTYLVPLLPIMISWDGVVSQLRTYTPEELLSLTSCLRAPDYRWTASDMSVSGVPFKVPYLIGCPTVKVGSVAPVAQP